MKIDEVPQDDNRTLAGHRKGVYARGADGRMVLVATSGWEVEEIVTTQAVDNLNELAYAAKARCESGQSSPLEYWMYAKRMDVDLLSQTTGLWRWRIRRHLQPQIFTKLSTPTLARYADTLGISVNELVKLP